MTGRRSAPTLDLGREALFAGGFVGVLWFAAYLYELGFLMRFGVPPTLADVGFPKLLTVAFFLAPAGAFLGSLGLMLAGLIDGDLRTPFLAVASAFALLLAGYGLGLDGWAAPLLMAADLEMMPLWLRVVLAGCVIVVAARVGAGWFDRVREGEAPQVCQASLFVLLLLLVPIGFGWLGAGRKAESSNTFLYLVDDPDFVLVRIYDEQAVFVRYDRARRTFGEAYRVVSFGPGREAFVSFRSARGTGASAPSGR